MAGANDFPLLAYLIDMAVLEAWREANDRDRPVGPNGAGQPASRG